MIEIPFWVAEVAFIFLMGVVLGMCKIRFGTVVALTALGFAIAVMVDPLLAPLYWKHLDILIVGNGLCAVYLILGWAIYETTPSKRR